MDAGWESIGVGAFFWLSSATTLHAYYRGVSRAHVLGAYGYGLQAAPFFAATVAVFTVGFLLAQLPDVASCHPGGLLGCEAPLARMTLAVLALGVLLLLVTAKEMLFPSRWRRLPSWWCDVYDPKRPRRFRRSP